MDEFVMILMLLLLALILISSFTQNVSHGAKKRFYSIEAKKDRLLSRKGISRYT